MGIARPKGGWRRTALVVLAVLIVAVTGGIWALNRTSRSRLRQTLDNLKAAGEVLTFAEIEAQRPPIPDADNGALVLVELMPQLEAASHSELLKSQPVPYLGDTHLPAWNEPWTDDMLAATAAYLQAQQALLEQLDKLQRMPRGRFPYKAGRLQRPELRIEHFQAVRSACKHEVLEAVYEAQLGNTRDAPRHVITALNINNTVATEPQLISMLVYVATDCFTCDAIERLLALGTYSDADLSRLAAVLAEHERSDALIWALRGELAWTKAAYDSSPNKLLAGIGRAVWFTRDTAKTLELVSRLLRAAEPRKGLLEEADAVQAEADALSRLYITTKMQLPSLHRGLVLWERRTATLRCTLAALAAERFRMQDGRWPNALDELVPEYLSAVPLDPFSAQPLRYNLGDALLTIYSVGENGVDDGGQVEWTGRTLPDVGFRLLPPANRVGRRDPAAE